jgi:cell fate regulator YaaT (PSP1 superfamily)
MGPLREPVPARLARDQALPNNPTQLQGSCGRLMCCLAYENQLYVDFRKRAPATGAEVLTDQGPGTVVGHVVPLDAVVVQVDQERFTCPLGRVCPAKVAASPPTAAGDTTQP